MFAALRKTAMSAIIYEVLDMGTGITDGAGNLASSGAGIPSFVGVLDKAVKRILELNARVAIAPGDVFVTNDPFYGGVTHLNDVVLAMPVFAEDELVAWTANIAHWNDVGGMVPGSISTDARELFQEGLRLPAVKLISQGRPIRSVVEILKANSRLPDFLHGDMWAGIAAARVGERRILELARRYGADTFVAALRSFMDHGERVARRALGELPQGVFRLEEEQDNGAVYRVTVEIAGDELVVDLRDNPNQDPGPNNVSRDAAVIAAQMALMNLTDPHAPANAGHYRAAARAHPPGLGLRSAAARRVRHLLRGADAALRPPAGGASRRTSVTGCPPATSARSAERSSAGRIPTPAGTSRSWSRRSAAGAARRRATGTPRCSARSTATRSTAQPRLRRPATACTSTGSRSTTGRAARASTAAARGSCSNTASARTAASSPARTRGTGTRRGRSQAAIPARRTASC